MRRLSYVAALAVVICALANTQVPASTAAADITGTWTLTIHYPPPDGDYQATYILKQDGNKITGRYEGMHGPADVTGTITANDVTMQVTVQIQTDVTAHFTGTVTSATKMNGTVTGTSSRGIETWSAEKKK